MAKVKVEVVGAVIDGNAPGAVIEVDEKSATYLTELGYVKKVKAPTKKAAPKSEVKKPSTKDTKDTKETE